MNVFKSAVVLGWLDDAAMQRFPDKSFIFIRDDETLKVLDGRRVLPVDAHIPL
jgi:hypothetical protein